MARIAGIDIPREKRLEISLTYIFGIGKPTAQKLCADLGLDPDTKVSALTDDEVSRIRAYVDENLRIEGDLRRDVQQDIKRKIEIGCYQGIRHRKGPAGERSAHPHQRPHPQGTQAHRRQQEEGREEVSDGQAEASRSSPPAPRPQERHHRRGAHQELVQQHDRLDHRPRGKRHRVGRRPAELATRARASRRRSPPSWPPSAPPGRRWSMVCAAPRCRSRAPALAVTPPCARSRTPASR